VRKRDGKGTLEGHRRRWENIIKIDLNEIEWEGVDWIHVAVDGDKRWDVLNAAMKRRVP
jgi:hypothetical protein